MKLNRNIALLVAAMAGIGTGAAVATAAETTTPAATTAEPAGGGHHHWRDHHGMLVGMTLRAARELNLTAEQQANIKTLLSAARTQQKAARAAAPGGPVDLSVLANPGDPNYAAALQSAKTLATTRIQRESELQGQIYNVLTAEQKTQLPTVLASMKAKAAQRRAAWQQKHTSGSSDNG